MKTKAINLLFAFGLSLVSGCNQHSNEQEQHQAGTTETVAASYQNGVYLNGYQFDAMDLTVDTIPQRTMRNFIETNGQLTLPPQSQAAVTAVIGANIQSVEVIEGSEIKKGQVLAYLYHPDLIKLQTEYQASINELEYLEKAFQRQQKLYSESVSAGKDFQRIQADYLTKKGEVNGFQAQLKQLGINSDKVKQGQIFERVALRAPITGHIQSVNVRTGQFVSPQQVLFEIVQNDHIHVHFKVFERDVRKIKEGQAVQFLVESQPGVQHEATVFSVGKVFEPHTKSINLHAEVDNEDGSLLPGMYARGRIVTGSELTYALPNEAVVMDNNRYFIFEAEQPQQEKGWYFHPVEVSVGIVEDTWTEIKFHQELDPDARFAWNSAYYLLAEMKKGEFKE